MKSSIYNIIIGVFIVFTIPLLLLFGCNKYKDPTPKTTNLLTNHFCNLPKAVNYNWGFPGIPDNSICIFPADIFVGNYIFYDSILDNSSSVYLPFDTVNFTITKITDTTLNILGQCGTVNYTATATKNYRFTLDSTNIYGQNYCLNNDTINGYAIKQNFNDSIFTYSYNLINNAKLEQHKGKLFKK